MTNTARKETVKRAGFKTGNRFMNLCRKIAFRIKLKQMDAWWYYIGGNCFQAFPPSFYYTHTEEEIKQAKAEIHAELDKLLADFEKKKSEKA